MGQFGVQTREVKVFLLERFLRKTVSNMSQLDKNQTQLEKQSCIICHFQFIFQEVHRMMVAWHSVEQQQ